MSGSIDRDHLELYVSGDSALLDEILTIFDEQARSLQAKFDADAEDEAWRDVMHALKGASRGVGAWMVGDLCEKAEAMVDGYDDKVAARRALLNDLNGRLEETLADALAARA